MLIERINEPLAGQSGQASSFGPMVLEDVRCRGEGFYADQLARVPGILGLGAKLLASPQRIRRALMARSLLLSEGMAPKVHAVARQVGAMFGIQAPVEVYQADGVENAIMHLVESPVLLEVKGKLLALLDEGALTALVGHEVGHYLAHGPNSPGAALIGATYQILRSDPVPDDILLLGLRYSMARELTADRFGLLACGDLDAALRLEMIAVTGLSGDSLTWDTGAFLHSAGR